MALKRQPVMVLQWLMIGDEVKLHADDDSSTNGVMPSGSLVFAWFASFLKQIPFVLFSLCRFSLYTVFIN